MLPVGASAAGALTHWSVSLVITDNDRLVNEKSDTATRRAIQG
jgi:hypothetical protein